MKKISFRSTFPFLLSIAASISHLKLVYAENQIEECGIYIGERDDDEIRHRRRVSLNLPKICNQSKILSIDIPHEGNVKRIFDKVSSISSSRRSKTNIGTNINSRERSVVESSTDSYFYDFWAGEDPEDGSIVTIIQDGNGHLSGSMVDITNHTVFQFHNQNGTTVVIITPSEDFDDEMDPITPPINSDRDIRKLSITPPISNEKSSDRRNNQNHDRKTPLSKQKIEYSSPSSSRSLYDDSGKNIDVMVVWTKAAECEAYGYTYLPSCILSKDSEENMKALIELAVQETNMAYRESGVDTELLLVHSYRHSTYTENTESPFQGTLLDLTHDHVPGVHGNRDTYGADIVAMIMTAPSYCGTGWIGPRRDMMFAVIKWSCATGKYSFGHEIGHTLGLNHDRGSINECYEAGYNYGYRDPYARFRTILAYTCYSNQCDNNWGGQCTRIPRFSNPNIEFRGLAIGTERQNNARALNDVKVEVAGYYKHVDQDDDNSSTLVENSTSNGNGCNDSPLRFKISDDNETFARYCSWVKKKDTKNRCRMKNVSSMCPDTCGTCSTCIDGKLRFKLEWKDGGKIARYCSWVGAKETKKRCEGVGVIDTCRVSCQNC